MPAAALAAAALGLPLLQASVTSMELFTESLTWILFAIWPAWCDLYNIFEWSSQTSASLNLMVGLILGAIAMSSLQCLLNWCCPTKRRSYAPDDDAGNRPRGEDDGGSDESPCSTYRDEAVWLEVIAGALWPRISEWIKDMVHNEIQPNIKEALPTAVRNSVNFAEPSLGENAPDFGPLRVRRRGAGGIELELGISMRSAVKIGISIMGVYVGVEEFCMRGLLSILCWPPSNKPPFFGGVEIFFTNPPDVSIHFYGAARIAEFPGFRGLVRGIIARAVATAMVLPRRIAVDLNEDDDVDVIDMRCPFPMGVLVFTLLGATDLVAANWSLIGRRTSDPYVMATLGAATWTSPVVNGTISPTWGPPGEGVTAEFPVHSEQQLLQLHVYDAGVAKTSDLIGQLLNVYVGELTSAPRVSLPLQLGDVDDRGFGAGKLHVAASVLQLSLIRGEDEHPGERSAAFLALKAVEIRGLPEDAKFPFQVRLTCGSKSMLSRASTPKPPLTAANMSILKSVCCSLHKRHYSIEDIMDITKLDKNSVQEALLQTAGGMTQQQTRQLKQEIQDAAAISAATNPHILDCLQLLIPDPLRPGDPVESVRLDLLDSAKTEVASLHLSMQDVLAAPSMILNGPFQLSGKTAEAPGISPELAGALTFRWLR